MCAITRLRPFRDSVNPCRGCFETHPIQPAEIRAFVLLFGSLGIVYHGSGLPRISEIPRSFPPLVPLSSLRRGTNGTHTYESRSRRFTGTVKYLHVAGSSDIRGIRSFRISRAVPIDRREFHPFGWKFIRCVFEKRLD